MTSDEAIAVLTKHGLTVTQSETKPKKANKQPKPVWLVSGRVEPFRQLLYDQGGITRFTGRNTFSFWDDPTIELAELVEARGEASIAEQAGFKDERSQVRADRYAERANTQQAKSNKAYARSNAAVEGIPMGQPILLGHHSEGTHRRALNKSHSAMQQSVEAATYASHLDDKAAGSQQQIGKRQTVEYMGNRLEEAKANRRMAQRALQDSPESATAKLRLQDADAAIAHWQTQIDAAGGVLDASQVKKGDTVKFIGSWYPVVRVNKKSVSIGGWMGIPDWTYIVPYHKIEGHQPQTKSDVAP